MGGLVVWFPGTKFVVPRLPVGLLARPRLVGDLAREVLAVPFTLLSAPAGYGKTIVATLLARGLTGARVCWVSVDADDDDPRRFVAALTAALRGGAPEVAADALLDP